MSAYFGLLPTLKRERIIHKLGFYHFKILYLKHNRGYFIQKLAGNEQEITTGFTGVILIRIKV